MAEHENDEVLFRELMTILGINHYKIDSLNKLRKQKIMSASSEFKINL